MKNLWSEQEMNILENNYPNKTREELLILLPNKTITQILAKAKKHQLI